MNIKAKIERVLLELKTCGFEYNEPRSGFEHCTTEYFVDGHKYPAESSSFAISIYYSSYNNEVEFIDCYCIGEEKSSTLENFITKLAAHNEAAAETILFHLDFFDGIEHL